MTCFIETEESVAPKTEGLVAPETEESVAPKTVGLVAPETVELTPPTQATWSSFPDIKHKVFHV